MHNAISTNTTIDDLELL